MKTIIRNKIIQVFIIAGLTIVSVAPYGVAYAIHAQSISGAGIFQNIIVNMSGRDRDFATFLRLKFGKMATLQMEAISVNKKGMYECVLNRGKESQKIIIDLYRNVIYMPGKNDAMEMYPIKNKGGFKCFIVEKKDFGDFLKDKKEIWRNLPVGYRQYLMQLRMNMKDVVHFIVQGSEREGFLDVIAVKKEGNDVKYAYLFGSGAKDRKTSKHNMLFYSEEYQDSCDMLINFLSRSRYLSELEDIASQKC